MNYVLDERAFKLWYIEHSKYPELLGFNINAAKVFMSKQFDRRLCPQYKLEASNTKSGYIEVFPPVEEEIDYSIHRPGYDYMVISACDGITYHKTSLTATMFAMALIKEYEVMGWLDDIETLRTAKITGNVVSLGDHMK